MSTSATGLTAGQRVGRFVRRAFVGVLLAAVLIVGGTALRVWQVARLDDRAQADAILVLGAAQYDGVPSSVFEARLDHAAALYAEGVAPLIVTVGGKQVGDRFTEAASGKNYLVEQGIPEAAVLAVEEGSDTLQSVRAAADVMAERDARSAVLVSDPTHSLRTRMMAEDVGLEAWTSPTRSGPAVWTRESQVHGIVRETAGILYFKIARSSVDLQ